MEALREGRRGGELNKEGLIKVHKRATNPSSSKEEITYLFIFWNGRPGDYLVQRTAGTVRKRGQS